MERYLKDEPKLNPLNETWDQLTVNTLVKTKSTGQLRQAKCNGLGKRCKTASKQLKCTNVSSVPLSSVDVTSNYRSSSPFFDDALLEGSSESGSESGGFSTHCDLYGKFSSHSQHVCGPPGLHDYACNRLLMDSCGEDRLSDLDNISLSSTSGSDLLLNSQAGLRCSLSDALDPAPVTLRALPNAKELDEEEEEPTEASASTPRGKWFDPAPALKAVTAIRQHLTRYPADLGFRPDASRSHWPADLMEELEGVQPVLEQALAEGKTFRFLVVG